MERLRCQSNQIDHIATKSETNIERYKIKNDHRTAQAAERASSAPLVDLKKHVRSA